MTSTVVLADDHPLFRRGLREALEAGGEFAVVGEAGDGLAALQLLRELRPHLAVLDVSMPGCDGLDVLAQTRTWADPPGVALLTMHDRYVDRALELGALGYLLKESAEDELCTCLRSVRRGVRFLGSGVKARGAAPAGPFAVLTPTERRVLKLLAQMMTSRQIAEVMCISHRTVQNHCEHMRQKLGLQGAKSLLAFALANREHL